MSGGRVVLLVVGSFLALIGVALLAGATVVLVVFGTQRDADGYFTSPVVDVSSDGHALVSSDIDLAGLADVPFTSRWLASVRVGVTPADDEAVFVGIGPAADVDAWLADVAHTELSGFGPRRQVRHAFVPGDGVPEPPATQDFWVASASGVGAQDVTWDLEPGNWSIVAMHADASPGLAVGVTGGVRTQWAAVGLVLLFVLALLCGAIGTVMAIIALRGSRTGPTDGTAHAEAEVRHPERV